MVYFSDVVWDEDNPWLNEQENIVKEWSPEKSDILFLDGLDWLVLNEEQRRFPNRPILNLIQHVRHADPQNERFQFLTYKAVRICVSNEVADALKKTERINGPLFTIPNGLDDNIYKLKKDLRRDIDILIVGNKQPTMARELRGRLCFGRFFRQRLVLLYSLLFYLRRHLNKRIKLLYNLLPRQEFLNILGRSKITVFIPNPTEGFFLPALEGMAMETLVICPDCVGNRSFCLDNVNCFRPKYDVLEISKSIHTALNLTDEQKKQMITQGAKTAGKHNLSKERESFLHILNNLPKIWDKEQ
jgi:glycosyltransferase involved in cell wall biosynthesis